MDERMDAVNFRKNVNSALDIQNLYIFGNPSTKVYSIRHLRSDIFDSTLPAR
jgi:hypothetical protein